MIERHLLKLRARDDITADEERAIRSSISEVKDYPADLTVIERGRELSFSTLLLDGILARYKDLRDGQRQISEVHVAGDFADLHSFTLKHLDHNIMTLTPCRVAIVPHDRLRLITEQHPHLTRVYWFLTNLDAAIHREWELSLGRRTALSRTANLFCEFHVRLKLVGLAEDSGYDLPLTQVELAECLGMTSVHINRTLKQLREQGAVDFRRGYVKLTDLGLLRHIAEFDPAYLYLGLRER